MTTDPTLCKPLLWVLQLPVWLPACPPVTPISPQLDEAQVPASPAPMGPQPGSQAQEMSLHTPTSLPVDCTPCPSVLGTPCWNHCRKELLGQMGLVLSPGHPPSWVSVTRRVLGPCPPTRPGLQSCCLGRADPARAREGCGHTWESGHGRGDTSQDSPLPCGGEGPDCWGAWDLLRLLHSRVPQTTEIPGPSRAHTRQSIPKVEEVPGK